ncbi:fungal-specific transcription factor domain-containing protein [Talaromyces proteolyticus]|uniref:Fungal-specific transcription factor domain-containing protein n=1 Tax=Talaromyces proteolyticus TaxID=1131652 RepID=A0AAD4PUT3_9EURO|nr:fungal-specific transcription factor domain-containing protein [Talaromyces proteolyticus]KAH8695471.1 fungal-specific transcription factor domain-containing protein [Talaromyces proteolyticus]
MSLESTPKGRIYKSRKSRPCDACRRRKVTCDMPTGPPCRRCVHMDKACTFEEGPSQRKRRIAHSQTNAEFECDAYTPFYVNPHEEKEDVSFQYMLTSELQHYRGLQETTENAANQVDAVHEVYFQNHSSTSSSPSVAGRYLSPTQPLGTTASLERLSTESEMQQTSLEFIPDAFSFYIGPTGVSDIHLLSQQQYDERKISRLKVRGLKYRVIDPESGDKTMDDNNFVPPTIFGITDRALLDKAEPRVDYQTNESAWSELWQILDPMGAWHLIGLYSRFVDPYFPIVSRHQIPNNVDSLSNMPLGLLTAMCATALPFIMYDEALYTLLLRPPSSQDLYRLAWLGVTSELHAPSLTTLQACLILQQRLPTNLYLSDTAFTWTLMSTAVSVAQTIGLHRDPSAWLSVPTWERQLRRRLWWALWVMEKWVALARGMPSHLHDDDSDVTSIAISDIQNTLSTHGDNHAHLYHLVNLTGILSDIQHTYYTVRAINRTSSDLQYSLEAAKSLRARLKDWRGNVPDELRFRARCCAGDSVQSSYGETLDGNGGLHLSYIVAHMTLFRALLRPLNNWPAIMLQSPSDQANAVKEGAKAVVRGALLCVKEFVEFIEALTETQWNAFWHSWSRPNFAIAGSFMVHVLHTIAPLDSPRQDELQAAGIPPSWINFEDDYKDLQVWIRRWRWANRVSANGAAGVKGLTNLGLMKVETLMENTKFHGDIRSTLINGN